MKNQPIKFMKVPIDKTIKAYSINFWSPQTKPESTQSGLPDSTGEVRVLQTPTSKKNMRGSRKIDGEVIKNNLTTYFYMAFKSVLFRVFLKVMLSFFIGAYLWGLFLNGDPYFIGLLEHFFSAYSGQEAVDTHQIHVAHCGDLAHLHRQRIVLECVACTDALLLGWQFELFWKMSEADWAQVLRESFALIRSALSLLTFQQWLCFWQREMFPLMPWSWLYTGGGVYSAHYKSYIRDAAYSCLEILTGSTITCHKKQLVYNFLSRIMLHLSEIVQSV